MWAFANHFDDSTLEEVVFEINSQLEHIEQHAFDESPIKKIKIPASVKRIDPWAFEDCTELENLQFAEGSQLKTIFGSTFTNCVSLESLQLPASIEEINPDAFEGCNNLKDLWINSPQSINVSSVAFEEGSLEFVFIKHDVDASWLTAYGLSNTGPVNDGEYDLWRSNNSSN